MRIGLGNDARAVYDEADSSARRDFGAISSIRDSAMALQQKKQRDMLVINHRISIPLDEFQWDYSRSGGPGGQNVNKVNSKVQLRWSPEKSPSLPPAVRDRLLALIGSKLTTEGELIVTSQESRDQARNLQICLDKIRALVLSSEDAKAHQADSRLENQAGGRQGETLGDQETPKKTRERILVLRPI